MNNALMDKDFLKKLDEYNQREVFVKIISLDFSEKPRTEIQGYATGGSINVDGSSAVRRTCSLTMIAENARVNELDWALETKFKLEVGLKNFIDKKYGDIIWFPQGTYILTSFSSSTTNQGLSISLQGKDKMCLLDGTIGGNIFASHDFGKLEIRHEDGSFELEPILIYNIIRNAIHEYALEPYENIIISDLEDCSVELIDYLVENLNAVIYNIYNETDDGTYSTNMAFQGNDIYSLIEQEKWQDGDRHLTEYGDIELVKMVSYGDTVGYRLTDLTYPTSKDLILNAGSTITQMLDELINLLGEFEYFYDLEGRFRFRRKRIYYNVSWNNLIVTETAPGSETNNKEARYDTVENGSENAYIFTKGILIESYNNKPEINNIKNDYTIWGNRLGIDGEQLPIHLRCAIDDKPIYYYPLLNEDAIEQPNGTQLWATSQIIIDEKGRELMADVVCDWRELIYRMAYDYAKSDTKILELNKQLAVETSIDKINILKEELQLWNKTWDTRYIAYYTDLLDFWRLLYNKNNSDWAYNYGWNPDYVLCRQNELILQNHTTIPFWLDFCEGGYLEKYKPANIGRRTKVINDNEVKSIFYKETPNVLFIDPLETQPYTNTDLSYTRLNLIGEMGNYFRISTQGKSAKEALDNLLYTHTYYCESITLSCIPIYYLEPNVRISVLDTTSGINGEYIIKSYSIPLAYNGSMSITATKAEDLIL